MRRVHLVGSAILACGFIFTGGADAALQVALGEVNTSVDVKPTTTKNKWKLETDPSIASPLAGPDLDDYIPVAGSLCDSYDPTEFQLAINPNTGTYGLGYTVQGEGPFEVTGFDVQTNDGGFIDVRENPTPGGPDIVTLLGNTGGGESGNILNIMYQVIPDRTDEVAPADTDQLFYQVNLTQIQDTDDAVTPDDGTFNPGIVTAFGNVNSFLTISTTNPNSGGNPSYTTDFSATGGPGGGPNFFPSSNVPEPTTAVVGIIGIAGLLGRPSRRRLT
jgi:hypothetical protein